VVFVIIDFEGWDSFEWIETIEADGWR